jgi:DNA polymerase
MGRPASERRQELIALYREARGCTLCPLAEGRTQVVFGAGNADADLMLVGEAPGFHEDQQGVPFVGRAGKLLDELLAANGLGREEVFTANVLKCRPAGNRDPQPSEIETCRPYLHSQVALIEPRVICTLGNFATKLLTGSQRGITQVHGQPQRHEIGSRSVVLYPLFHPAAALRTPKVSDQLAEDFGRLPALLAASPPAERAPARGAAAADPQAGPEVEQLGLLD